jgi:hypothetical protein
MFTAWSFENTPMEVLEVDIVDRSPRVDSVKRFLTLFAFKGIVLFSRLRTLFKTSSFLSLFVFWFFVLREFRLLTLKCRYQQYTFLERCIYLRVLYPPILPTTSCGYTC